MMKKWVWRLVCISVGTLLVGSVAVQADSVQDAMVLAANKLVDDQIPEGELEAGAWPAETGFTGSILPGLLETYRVTCNPAYLDTAELAAEYIIGMGYPGYFYGDETYSLTLLSEFAEDPGDNYWRTVVSGFYEWIRTNEPGGTVGYIDAYYQGTTPSVAVFYMAHHVMAAYYADAEDKAIWRDGLVRHLIEVGDDDDYFEYPVTSLGIAVWALAQTGPCLAQDTSLVKPGPGGQPYWQGEKMQDLPGLLLGHQVPDGQNYAGTFYWRFDHDGEPSSGYTEDAVYGTLGLVAADEDDPGTDYSSAICAAKTMLPQFVYVEYPGGGIVYDHINEGAIAQYHYSGELIQALSAYKLLGDIDDSGCVDVGDLAVFASYWLTTDCAYDGEGGCTCEGADLNLDGTVNLHDFAILSNQWLKCSWNCG